MSDDEIPIATLERDDAWWRARLTKYGHEFFERVLIPPTTQPQAHEIFSFTNTGVVIYLDYLFGHATDEELDDWIDEQSEKRPYTRAEIAARATDPKRSDRDAYARVLAAFDARGLA